MALVMKPREKRAAGWVLSIVALLGGVGILAFYVYVVEPFREEYRLKHADPATNSPEKYEASLLRWRRVGWLHYDFVDIGHHGDTEVVREIMSSLKPDRNIHWCDAGHLSKGLAFLTNQNMGDKSDDWLRWWEQNRELSQQQWFDEGFRQLGLNLHKPLTRDDALELLRIIGIPAERDRGYRSRIPSPPEYLTFNAMRALRDYEFEPEDLTVEELSTASGNLALRGALRYQVFRKQNPKHYGVGVVYGKKRWDASWGGPYICEKHIPLVCIGSGSVLLALGLLGGSGLWRSRARK